MRNDGKNLMHYDPDKPGFLALLRGEGEEPMLNVVAWLAFVFYATLILAVAIHYIGEAL